MPLPNGINKNNFTPKGNSSPLSGGNSKPTGVTSGTWVSGNKTQRGDSISQRRKRGLNKRARSLKKISQPQPSNTATNATAASGAAVAKQGITQKTLSVSGKLAKAARPVIAAIKAVTLIGAAKVLGLATAFVGLFAKGTSDGTLPDWIKDVGEQEVITAPPLPEWYGGQNPSKNYNLKYGKYSFVPGNVWKWVTYYSGQPQFLVLPITKVRLIGNGVERSLEDRGNSPYTVRVTGINGNEVTWMSTTGAGIRVYGFHPADGSIEADPYAGVPSNGTGVITTTPSKFPSAEDLELNDNKVSSASIPAVNVSRGITKPDNNSSLFNNPSVVPSPIPNVPNIKRGLPNPEPKPEGIPEPELKPEKSVDDISEPDDKEVIAPPVISTRSSIRADGTRETTTTREATPEELRDLQRTTTEALETVDTYRETTQFRGGIDAFVPSPGSPSQPGTFEETTRTPALPPNITPPPNITDDSNIKDPNPQPDIEDEDETPFIPPPPVQTPPPECKGCNKKILDKMDTLTLGAQGLDLALVQQIHSTVHSSAHGLAKIQGFAETAWRNSGADKVLNVVGTVASLHNAAMLSQNAAQSMGEVVNNGLALFNIKGFDGQPINVNETIDGFISDKLAAIFGEANLQTASEIWLRLNRIHMAVSSVVWSIQGTKNALLEADEITGGHVAKIGNALQEQGFIEEDTYDWMNPQPNYQQPFRGLLGKIDSIEDMTNRVSSVVSTGLEIKENTTELVTNSNELVTATNDFLTTKNTAEEQAKTESTSPDIDRLDTIKYEPAEQA